MPAKLNAMAFGYASAITSAVGMILLGILGNIGVYRGAAQVMEQWQMFFSLSLVGIITGTIEAAIIGFIFGWLFGWLYNRFV